MTEIRITVAEAARNLPELVNRARDDQQSFVLVQNGVAVAQLVPVEQAVCRGSDLAAVLANAIICEEDARIWSRDRMSAREILHPPEDNWK